MRDVKLVLLAPFYISRATVGGSFRRKVLETLPAYVEKVEKLSREFGAIYVNLHAMFQELIKHREPTAYAPEAVHPTFAGHMAIALALMEALEDAVNFRARGGTRLHIFPSEASGSFLGTLREGSCRVAEGRR